MKFFQIIFFFLILSTCFSLSSERSEKEIKLGVFIEDLEEIGKYKKIDSAPSGMFPEKADTFFKKQIISQKEFIKIFVTQKGLMEKYTDRVILGMGHFEFFYMQQLKDKEDSIETFKKKYPVIGPAVKKDIQQLYGLNKVRKSMRESIGLSLKDDADKVISRYYTLFKLLNQADIKKNKLNKNEKNKIKNHNKIAKTVSRSKSLIEDKLNNRITEKKFLKEYQKNYKKLLNELKKTTSFREYELLTSFLLEIENREIENLNILLSAFKVSEFILENIKKQKLPKKFDNDLSNAKFEIFNDKELNILGEITSNTKKNKIKKSNEIQLQMLNLENYNIPVNRLFDYYHTELNINLETINLRIASASKMKEWKLSDWANAWKNPIPNKIIDDSGIEIKLSEEDIESIKAQLAMQNFKEIINLEDFKELINFEGEGFEDIQKSLELNSETFNFSFGLDDFAQAYGDAFGIDINNYADLTDLANAQHNANWSVEEYASAYKIETDIINALKSGAIDSFDAGEIARQAQASLQEVADTIAVAAAAGVEVDLESTAQGLGYDSFAAAVDAYNKAHGTNYSVDQAREALDQ